MATFSQNIIRDASVTGTYGGLHFSDLNDSFQPSLLPQSEPSSSTYDDAMRHTRYFSRQEQIQEPHPSVTVDHQKTTPPKLSHHNQQRYESSVAHDDALHARVIQQQREQQSELPQTQQMQYATTYPAQLRPQRVHLNEHYTAPVDNSHQHSNGGISGVIDLYGSKKRELLRLVLAALTISLGMSMFWFSKKMFKQFLLTPERRAVWDPTKSVTAHASLPLLIIVIIWSIKVFFPTRYS